MASNITVTLTAKIASESIEPDGQKCFCCEDVIYGGSPQLIFLIIDGARAHNMDLIICESCFDEAELA